MIIRTFHPSSSLHFTSFNFPSLHFTELHYTSFPIFHVAALRKFRHHASKTHRIKFGIYLYYVSYVETTHKTIRRRRRTVAAVARSR